MATKIEKCGCNQSLFYRAALRYVRRVAGTDTHQTQYEDLDDIRARAAAVLEDTLPGSEPPCSCDESQHLRKALTACVNVCLGGKGQQDDQPIEDVAQCNNFADQGLRLQPLTGDPGVYDCAEFIPTGNV